MKRKLPFIPLQKTDMGAEFAGMQYVMPDCCDHGKLRAFKNELLGLVYSNFKWYGLEPYEINMIEECLIRVGRVAAVKTDKGVFFGTPSEIGGVDFYGMPERTMISGFNGTQLESTDFVFGFDNCAYSRYQSYTAPIITMLEPLARELVNAFEAWKVAAETHKTGMVFCTQNARSSKILQDVLHRVSGNDPYVIVESNINEEITPMFAPNYTAALSEYHNHFMNVWSYVMDMLGIENSPQNKRERLVVSEAEMNRSLSRYIAAGRLKARKDFATEISTRWGRDIRVENYLESVIQESQNNAQVYGNQGKGGEPDDNKEQS